MDLTALQHSALLQSLGWAIANSMWQAAALWIIYKLVSSSYKNSTARFRNNSSTMLLFAVFGWFLITFIGKFLELRTAPGLAVEESGEYAYTLAGGVNMQTIVGSLVRSLPYLSVAYLLLVILLAVRLVHSYLHIYSIKNHGLQKPPVEWRLFTQKVALHIGLNKKISLWFSTHVDVPATIGFLKPMILIPIASINQLTSVQLEAIILHELSHIRRNDYLINLFISIIETVLFFNPFVVLLSKVIKRERENCCDDFVIQYQYDRLAYASALLSLEQQRKQPLRLAIAATSGKKQLLGRVKRIMESGPLNSNFNYGQKLMALFLITGLMCSIAWLSPGKKDHKASIDKGNASANIITKAYSPSKAKKTIIAEVKVKDARKALSNLKDELIKTPLMVKDLKKALSSTDDMIKYYMEEDKVQLERELPYIVEVPDVQPNMIQQDLQKLHRSKSLGQKVITDLKKSKIALTELQLQGIQLDLKRALDVQAYGKLASEIGNVYTTVGKNLVPEEIALMQKNVVKVMEMLNAKNFEINHKFVIRDSLFPKAAAMYHRAENFDKLAEETRFTYHYTTPDIRVNVPTTVTRARKAVEPKTKTKPGGCSITVTSNNGSTAPDGWVLLNNAVATTQSISLAKGKTVKLLVSNGKELMEIRIEN